MILRSKTLIAVGAALVGLIAILYATSHAILLKSYAELEQQNTRAHVERARDALLDRLAELDRQLADWAAWDETYTFVQDASREYVKKNLPDKTFVDLRINLMLVVSSSGRLVFGRAFDLETQRRLSPLKAPQEYLAPGSLLLQHRNTESSVTGMILLPEGPMLIASRPILTSEREGPIRGTLMMGRFLTAAEITRLAQVTHLSLAAHRFDDPRMPPDFQAVRSSLAEKSQILVKSLGARSTAGYALLSDIYGKPALILRVHNPRTIYDRGLASIRYFILWFVAVGLVFGIVTVSLFERLVLSRHRQWESEERYRALVEEASPLAIFALDPGGSVRMWNTAAARMFGWDGREVLDRPLPVVPPEGEGEFRALCERAVRGEGLTDVETRQRKRDGSLIDVSISMAPLHSARGDVISIMGVVADITERKRAEERIRRQLQRLDALHTIDMAITGSMDLRVTFSVLLDQVTAHLSIDAADILLLNPDTQTLEYAAGRGFRTAALLHTRLRLGESHAGRAALERRIVGVPSLLETPGDFIRAPRLAEEGFVAYYAAPLISKGQIKGVLEIFHRSPLSPDPEWLSFLEALVAQAAVAVDNATLFEDLQRSNVDLTLAYNTTLEGWSRALDLRDEGTQGHTQRVTELTLRLASAMGVSDAELVHVRRGALLHDMGKMAIPDSILLKAGPLTEDEWEIMRRHPVNAYELLSPIPYLRPALDIPYCHHEKWDGTGYPRGLKAEQIPLAVRVFAVVDVWDALTSERPYRPAWTKEQAREYIKEQAGKHFDPKVVEAFMKMLNET